MARYKDRFRDLYRWQGLPDDAIEALWRDRTVDEWPLIDGRVPAPTSVYPERPTYAQPRAMAQPPRSG